ncbi:hypothetical protein NST15_05015 [Bacillus sp. FSL R5-0820]|uniref:hypothetical protein n=1 Tax=Bacillus TaxID=1386 RepID=UPI00064FFB9E|nr:hypothetical protein [Bacillus altitudinis]ANT56056.1 membrane protein [Bacillus pumilus]KML02033.1 membrane protein [Bacillus stratosphericus]KAJ0072429.1 hypothetical protein DBB48_010050 [Bacillus altitudinis]KML57751.1 membrane protein [Bacillus stratosphericus]MCM3229348.1 hypothetical protein [Bacillus altitudinis]
MSVFLFVFTCMCVIFAGGSIHYVRQLGYAASYPPKHVLRQKAIVCAAGAGISLSILLLTLFLL